LGASSAMFAAAGLDQVARGATAIGALLLLVSVAGAVNGLTWARRFDQGGNARPETPVRAAVGNASQDR